MAHWNTVALEHSGTPPWGRCCRPPPPPSLAPARTAVVERCCTLDEERLSKLVLAHCCTLGEGHCYIPVGELSYIPAWELVLPHCCTLAWARFGIAPWALAWGHFCTLALAHLSIPVWELVLQHCCTLALGPGDKQEQQLRHTHPKLLQSLLRSLRVLIRRSRHWSRRWTRHRKAEHSRRPHRTRCCRPAR